MARISYGGQSGSTQGVAGRGFRSRLGFGANGGTSALGIPSFYGHVDYLRLPFHTTGSQFIRKCATTPSENWTPMRFGAEGFSAAWAENAQTGHGFDAPAGFP